MKTKLKKIIEDSAEDEIVIVTSKDVDPWSPPGSHGDPGGGGQGGDSGEGEGEGEGNGSGGRSKGKSAEGDDEGDGKGSGSGKGSGEEEKEGEGGGGDEPPDLMKDNEKIGSNESEEQEQKRQDETDEDTTDTNKDGLEDTVSGEDINTIIQQAKEEEQEVINQVKEQRQARSSGIGLQKQPTSLGILSKKLSNKYAEILRMTDKWCMLLRGKKQEDLIQRSDVFSRRIPGFLGREMDNPDNKKGKKILILYFDTSGSIDIPMLNAVCGDVAIRLTNSKVIDEVCCLNIDGDVKPVFEPGKNIKSAIKRATNGSGSGFAPMWRQLIKILYDKQFARKQISGILIWSDICVDSPAIPTQIIDKKIPILFMCVPPTCDDRLMQAMRQGPVSAILMAADRKAKLARPMRVR